MLGPEKGALQKLPLMGSMALGTLPGNLSKKLRTDIAGDFVVSYHPVGLVAFISRTRSGLLLNKFSSYILIQDLDDASTDII